MAREQILAELKQSLKEVRSTLENSEAKHQTNLRNFVNIENDCETAAAKLTSMQTSLKEWTHEMSNEDMTTEREKVLTEELKKMELTLDGFDHFEYDLQKLHSDSTAECKVIASIQRSYRKFIGLFVGVIDKEEGKLPPDSQHVKELIELRLHFNQMISKSQNIGERFEALEGSQTYSEKQLSDFNDQLDKVCREFSALRSRHVNRIRASRDAAAKSESEKA